MNDYDKNNPQSIEDYSQKLIGKTFRDVVNEDSQFNVNLVYEKYGLSIVKETKRNKGNLGQLIEERFFHYANNSESQPDFKEAGVELKVSPLKQNKNGSISAKERLVLSMIDYFEVVTESFNVSHFWNKSRLILLIYYLYNPKIKDNLDYKIQYSKLFTPPIEDLNIIKNDYDIIVNKIKAGKAHELSESDTMYLSACTKGATASNRREQPYSDVLAKPRAFAYKASYMTHIINHYFVPGKSMYEPIIKTPMELSFTDYVLTTINQYAGISQTVLVERFNIDTKKQKKDLGAMIAFRILGVKSNQAEEFEKANIVVKTIRIKEDGGIKESMSFPTFKYTEIVKEDWEDSTFGNYLRETKFLFVVYRFNSTGELILQGAQFWNMPLNDIENHVRPVWELTKKVIDNGLEITIDSKGVQHSNMPTSKKMNPVCHVRPHGQNAKDTYPLPDGRTFTRHCFWLNNTYIYNQLDPKFKP